MKGFALPILTMFLILTSCGADNSGSNRIGSSTSAAKANNSCNCFFSYNPVCGVDGKTYDNACIAECFGVQYQTSGSCSDLANCNANSGTVCARPPMPACSPGMACIQAFPPPRYYNNECEARQAGAQLLAPESCN